MRAWINEDCAAEPFFVVYVAGALLLFLATAALGVSALVIRQGRTLGRWQGVLLIVAAFAPWLSFDRGGAALLGYAWRNSSKKLGLASAGMLLRGATGYCPAYAAMGVNHADTREALSGARGIHVRESITINAPTEDIYRFWRQLDRLPEVKGVYPLNAVLKNAERFTRLELSQFDQGASAMPRDASLPSTAS